MFIDKQNLLIEFYRFPLTGGKEKEQIGASLISLTGIKVGEISQAKYDVVSPESNTKLGSVELSIVVKNTAKRKSLAFLKSVPDEEIIKEANKKAASNFNSTHKSLDLFLMKPPKEDLRPRDPPRGSEYQMQIEQLEKSKEMNYILKSKLKKLKLKEEERKATETMVKKLFSLPPEEVLLRSKHSLQFPDRLYPKKTTKKDKTDATLRSLTLSDSKIGVAFIFTNFLCFKVPHEKYMEVIDLCKVENPKLDTQFSFKWKAQEYVFSEKSPVKRVIPILKGKFSSEKKPSKLFTTTSSSEMSPTLVTDKTEFDSEEEEEQVDVEDIFTISPNEKSDFLQAEEFEKAFPQVTFKCSPVHFFRLFFSDEVREWEKSLLQVRGNKSIEIAGWISPNKNEFKREINYIAPVSGGPPFCPKVCITLFFSQISTLKINK